MKKGFTLLELLIVVAIIAILSVIIIFVLNPAETLRKARDSQRMSDLNTLKTALGLYLTATSSPKLDAAAADCLTNNSGTANASAQIYYSAEIANPTCAAAPGSPGADAVSGAAFPSDFCKTIGTTGAAAADGTGWTPVGLSNLIGGSPISNLPLDPTNTIGTATAPTSTDLVYRYTCQNKATGGKPSYVFEIDAQLESDEFTSIDNKRAKDGGDNSSYYEVGNSLKLLPTGATF
ncbi:MAG: type II secretion system protein [Patescibacteria group bacterium]